MAYREHVPTALAACYDLQPCSKTDLLAAAGRKPSVGCEKMDAIDVRGQRDIVIRRFDDNLYESCLVHPVLSIQEVFEFCRFVIGTKVQGLFRMIEPWEVSCERADDSEESREFVDGRLGPSW